MTLSTSPDDHDLSPSEVDLSTIFIGREQQLDWFHFSIDRWRKIISASTDVQITTTPSPTNKIKGLVILLYGRGGFGKSTLLQRYHEIALTHDQKFIVSKIVDWEFAIEGKRSLFNPGQNQEIDGPEYYKLLCSQLAWALGQQVDDFKEYQAAVKAVEEAQKQARDELNRLQQNLQKDDRYAGVRSLTVEALMLLMRRIPLSSLVLGDEKVAGAVKEVVGEGVKIGAEQLVQVYTKIHNRLGKKLDSYREPDVQLSAAIGRDLSNIAKNFPLLIFFDTYEEVDKADNLLRKVMGYSSDTSGLGIGRKRELVGRFRTAETRRRDGIWLQRNCST